MCDPPPIITAESIRRTAASKTEPRTYDIGLVDTNTRFDPIYSDGSRHAHETEAIVPVLLPLLDRAYR